VAAAIDLIVQVGRMATGERKILHVQEVTGIVDNNYMLQELFSYDLKQQRFMQLEIKPHNVKLQRSEKDEVKPVPPSRPRHVW
jgi:pilus assembly protein CpaF